MKKFISLSAAICLTAMAFAQDTIPTPQAKNFPKDTVPLVNKNAWKDTSLASTANSDSMAKKWTDTTSLSGNNKLPDTTASAMATPTMTKKDTVPTSNAQANAAADTSGKQVVSDRVMVKDDQVVVIKNGETTVLQDSITLSSGAVVTKDGTITYKDGKTKKLKNGQYIALEGSGGKKPKKIKP